jgi:hypothetical protein
MVFPTYEFRPLPNVFRGEFKRYAEGKWIPDDGEYDLAFCGRADGGYPLCFYVHVPSHENIVCSWFTRHWGDYEPKHPGGNAWHYALREGTKDWGNEPSNYDGHPNRVADESGMSETSRIHGCANGDGVEFHPDDPHIKTGLLRDAKTKEVFQWPTGMRCMYCGTEPPLSAGKG